MKNSVSYEVWELVHSLSPNEKSYCKRSFLDRSTGKLKATFDIVNKMTTYDEELLRKKVKAKYPDLPTAFRLLRESVLRELARFHSAKSPLQEVNQLLSEAQVAFDKNLYSICERCVSKGLRISEENELTLFRFHFWNLRAQIPSNSVSNYVELLEETQEVARETAYIAQLNAELLDLKVGHQRFLRWSRLTKENYEEYKNSVDANRFLELVPKLGSQGHKDLASSFQWSLMLYFYSLGEMQSALNSGINSIERFGKPSSLSDKLFRSWLKVTGSIMPLAIVAYSRKTFLEIRTNVVSECKNRGFDALTSGKTNIQVYDILDLIRIGELDDALQRLYVLINRSSKNAPIRSDWTVLSAFLQYAHFLNEDYSKTLQLCNDYLASDDSRLDAKTKYQLRWLELITSFLMEDENLFTSKLRAMKRFLKSWGTGFDWEKKILGVLKDTIGYSVADRKASFKKLHQQLSSTEEELYCCVQNFDILAWVQSLAQNRPMIDVVKEKYLQ